MLARALAPLGQASLDVQFQPEPVTVGMFFDADGPPSAPPEVEPWERQVMMANPMSPLGGLPPSSVTKHVVGRALAPYGRLEFNKVVESDPISLDLWFEPFPGLKKIPPYLQLLHRMAPKPTLFELPASLLDKESVDERMHKHLNWDEERHQRAVQNGNRRPRKHMMWIVCKGKGTIKLLEGFGLRRDSAWPDGFYQAAPGFSCGVVFTSELKEEVATLILRLLGSKTTRSHAAEEVRSMTGTVLEATALRELLLIYSS
jgi:hypothetical protein